MKRLLPIVVMLAVVSGCRGPKGSPGGTVKSFFSSIVAEDWESMADIASQKSLQKVGSKDRAMKFFAQSYGGWKGADVSIDEELIDVDGNNATVHFSCVSTQIENYKEVQYDCGDIYTLVREDDGKWHLHLPGANKLRAM